MLRLEAVEEVVVRRHIIIIIIATITTTSIIAHRQHMVKLALGVRARQHRLERPARIYLLSIGMPTSTDNAPQLIVFLVLQHHAHILVARAPPLPPALALVCRCLPVLSIALERHVGGWRCGHRLDGSVGSGK